MGWRRRAPILRSVARRSIPELVDKPALPPARRFLTVTRHLGSAVVGWWLFDRRRGRETSRQGLSQRVRGAAEVLGPTYIKLGQIISSGEGLFPPELVAECRLLRDQVPPQSFTEVRRVIEEDLDRTLEQVFAEFEREPLAAASIAQVHRARLVTGETVVVKVQRSAVTDLVRRDLKVLAWLAPFLVGRIPVAALANPPALVELFAETITEELDFRLEADNMLEVARSFTALGQTGYVVPRPHPELVTRRVLVMEELKGYRFDDVAGIKEAGIDVHAILRTGMIGFMEGAMMEGIFHGDLHGGNLFIQPDGRVALLDYGITGRLDNDRRVAFLRMLMAATTNDVKGQFAALRDLGMLPIDTDLDAVIADLGLDQPPIDPTTLGGDELLAELQRVMKALLAYGARLPKEIMLFMKNMVFLDGAIAALAPELDLLAEIQHLAMYFATTHGQSIAEQIGAGADDWHLDMDGVKAGFGIEVSTERLTYAELRARRELIRSRLSGRLGS
ncbi:MAG: AarF/ABC1/UbiB kinase family protein [Actinomycetia bacterium]|nr:AarF/ABC1/UbiB kinase family protein [Actinomycetes bacterium]